MRVALLRHESGYSSYLDEILNSWGLRFHEQVGADAVAPLDPAEAPVLIVPAGTCEPAVLDYAGGGGTVVAFLPTGSLADAAGWRATSDKPSPLRLRFIVHASGVAGETLPIVGPAVACEAAEGVRVLAYLHFPDCYEDETPGITEAACGKGRIIAFAFDLPQCVWRLRQGDPARAEHVPSCDACARPIHMAYDIGGCDYGYLPFADLLARYLVDLVRDSLAAPVPMLSHLPGAAPAIVLWSGDEDVAKPAWIEEEFAALTAAGARMSLYVIPEDTNTTPEVMRRYRLTHDVGPHPNLRPLDGKPVDARVKEYARQIRAFIDRFGFVPATVRQHCLAWAGYLDLVEVQEQTGIGMDGNYVSASFGHGRWNDPYAPFGAALPMRFCRPDGRLLDVLQQPTHIEDDVWFDPKQYYSMKITPEAFAPIIERMLDDACRRFHTPCSVNLHPGSWVLYSKPQGMALLAAAAARAVPVWSFDQWNRFWRIRDGWRFTGVRWSGTTLSFTGAGRQEDSELRLMLPVRAGARTLKAVTVNDNAATWEPVTRYGQPVALVGLPSGALACGVRAAYTD